MYLLLLFKRIYTMVYSALYLLLHSSLGLQKTEISGGSCIVYMLHKVNCSVLYVINYICSCGDAIGVRLQLRGAHLCLQLLQLVLASMRGFAGEGPVVVGCTYSFTVHHVVVHQTLQHFLHSHWSLKEQKKERMPSTLKRFIILLLLCVPRGAGATFRVAHLICGGGNIGAGLKVFRQY